MIKYQVKAHDNINDATLLKDAKTFTSFNEALRFVETTFADNPNGSLTHCSICKIIWRGKSKNPHIVNL